MRTLSLPMGSGVVHAVVEGPLDGSRPIALLLHGGHGSWRHWRANLSSLARIVDPVAIDLPGYGDSSDVEAGLSLGEYAAVIDDALASLPPLAVIVGFSFGTLVGSEIARRRQTSVGFRGLVLINPPLGPEVTAEVLEILDQGARETRRGGLLAGVEVTQKRIMLSDPSKVNAQLLADAAEQVRRTRFKSRPISRSVDIRDLIRGLECSVHMVLGGCDPHQRAALGSRLSQYGALLGPARVHLVPQAAHWLAYEHPEVVESVVERLLAERELGTNRVG